MDNRGEDARPASRHDCANRSSLAGDPERVAFAALHSYSVAALGVAIIAALLVCFIVRNRSRTLHEWERTGSGNYRTR